MLNLIGFYQFYIKLNKYKIITFFQSKKIYEKFSMKIFHYLKWDNKLLSFFSTAPFLTINKIFKTVAINKNFENKINKISRKLIYSEKYYLNKLPSRNIFKYKIDLIFHDLGKILLGLILLKEVIKISN